MSPQVSVGMIIRYASHNLIFIYSTNTKELQRVPQSFYRRVKKKTCPKVYTMMKMATGEGSPSGRVPEQDPDRFLVATEACGGGTPDLLCSLMFSGYMDIYIGERSRSGEPRGAHEGGGRALDPRGHLVASLTSTPSLLDCVCSKNDPHEGFIPFGFYLIFLFCETLK